MEPKYMDFISTEYDSENSYSTDEVGDFISFMNIVPDDAEVFYFDEWNDD